MSGGRRTGFVTDESFFWQTSTVDLGEWVEGRLGLESPEPRRRLLHLLRRSGLSARLHDVAPVAATAEDLALVHDPAYVARIRRLSAAGGGEAGDFAAFGPGSYEIAALAAGAAATAVRAVVDGGCDNVYALVRPPGHHAERDRGRGYCLFGNVAVAVAMARRDRGIDRVAVVDLDVHHGNGTEQAFLADPGVLTISVHQDRCYPDDSGFAAQTGTGPGRGTNLNVPLPPGSGTGAYRAVLAELVLPALAAFRPGLVVVAAGYDAGGLDPLGRMLLPAAAFGELTGMLLTAADELCDGRLVVVQEGGYSALHVPFCGLRVVETLSGERTTVEDPFAWLADLPGQELTRDQRAALDAVRAEVVAGGVHLAS